MIHDPIFWLLLIAYLSFALIDYRRMLRESDKINGKD